MCGITFNKDVSKRKVTLLLIHLRKKVFVFYLNDKELLKITE